MWSMAKEQGLRDLRPVGDEYSRFLGVLSKVDDADVPATVERIRAERPWIGCPVAEEGRALAELDAIKAEHDA